MSADAFDSGRRRIQARHRWEKARKAVRVLWYLALGLLPVALTVSGVYYLDLQVYRTGGLAWLEGVPLYVDFPGPLDGPRLPFTYPPIAAAFFSALTALPVWLMNSLVVVTSFVLLSVVCLIATSRLTQRPHVGWTVAPAAAIKLTPAIFVLYFLARRDWRAAITSMVAFAGFAAAGFLAAPKDSVEYWFHALQDPSRVGGLAYMANQSIRGVLHRVNPGQPAETLLWVLLSAIIVVLAVIVARRTRSDVVALLGIALAGLLVSPVSWSHHWVWCVPAFLALGFAARRTGTKVAFAALLVIFCVQPFTWLPSTGDREMTWTWWQHIPGDAYVWVGLATLVVLTFTAVSPSARPTPSFLDGSSSTRV